MCRRTYISICAIQNCSEGNFGSSNRNKDTPSERDDPKEERSYETVDEMLDSLHRQEDERRERDKQDIAQEERVFYQNWLFHYYQRLDWDINMKCILFFLLLVSHRVYANSLLGLWESDNKRTLMELKSRKGDYSKWIQCYQTGLCGNYKVLYEEKVVRNMFSGPDGKSIYGNEISYSILKKEANFYLIKYGKEEPVKIYLSDHGFYMEVDGFFEYFFKSDVTTVENNQDAHSKP